MTRVTLNLYQQKYFALSIRLKQYNGCKIDGTNVQAKDLNNYVHVHYINNSIINVFVQLTFSIL